MTNVAKDISTKRLYIFTENTIAKKKQNIRVLTAVVHINPKEKVIYEDISIDM